MIRRTSTILLVSLLLVAFLAMTAFAAKVNQDQKGRHGRAMLGDKDAKTILAYSFADESTKPNGTKARLPLGAVTASSQISPGITFGTSWYDQQHNGSIGRMIETGPHSGETGSETIVHMGWMYLESDDLAGPRGYAYSCYNTDGGALLPPVVLLRAGGRGGYVNVDVTPDNRAIVGGHYYDSTTCEDQVEFTDFGVYAAHMFFDGGPGYATFPNYTRVPDSVQEWGSVNTWEAIWPKFFLQFGTDTVLHVVANQAELSDKQGSEYFRCVGFEGDGVWDYPPYIMDTVQDIAVDVKGQRNGDKIVITWFAGLPYQEPTCDTCSGEAVGYEGLLLSQMDNDIYYQESLDQGATFLPKVNMTKVPIGAAAYKPFCDASSLYDSDENLHIIWHAIPWAEDTCIYNDGPGFCFQDDWHTKSARLMHWSENVPYIRPIADQVFDVDHEVWDSCFAGAWNATISKPTISECDGNLYAIWVQFNDGKQGVINDCAEWAWKKDDPFGSANGDVWVSVSEDMGMTWDYQRNLTNSYTPHCDPDKAGDCASDHWPSMSGVGRLNQSSEDWSGAVIVDPSGGSYTGDYYLEVMYVEDMEAGICVQDEGGYTNNNFNWFRLPCVDPVPAPLFTSEWSYYGDPNYCKPGESAAITLQIENIGNTVLTYTHVVVGDWLGVTGFSGSLPSGLDGIEVGDLVLNQTNMTATGNYFGTITFDGNDPKNLPAVIEIELIIADTIVAPSRDTVSTNVLSLVTSNCGNIGSDGDGRLNMDFFDYGDCDTLRGEVYLYDGSPLIGRILPGPDTLFNWKIWGTSYFNEAGFRPQGGELPTMVCGFGAEVFQGGTFTTQDSCLGVQQIMVAPEDQTFILQYLKIWSFDGGTHDNVMIGEGIDWDIPTDFKLDDTGQQMAATNFGAADGPRGLVYCQGVEEPWDDDTLNSVYDCTDNSRRFGGNAFVESYLNDAYRTSSPYSGFCGENDSLQTDDGFFHGKLWMEMAASGLRGTDSVEDLHTVLTYEKELDFGASDVYEVVTVLATIYDGSLADFQAVVDAGKTWYHDNGGMDMFDDFLDDEGNPTPNGIIDVCEGCCRNMGNFYQTDGGGNPLPDPELLFNAADIDDFINWQYNYPQRDPDCFDEIDVDGDGFPSSADIDYLIAYLYQGGPAPVPCP